MGMDEDIKCRCSANQSEDDDERDDHASWCLANPNRGLPDAEVTNSAEVTHRCEYRAAAYDRKLYADEMYRQLREMREAVLAIHAPVPTWTDSTLDTLTGEVEQNALYADDGSLIYAPDRRMHCAACPVDVPWPCPTAQAAGAA